MLDWRSGRGNPTTGLHPTIWQTRIASTWPDRRLGQLSERTSPDDLARSKRLDLAGSSGRPRIKITTGDLASRKENVQRCRDNPIEPGSPVPANIRRSGRIEAPRFGQIVRWRALSLNWAISHSHTRTPNDLAKSKRLDLAVSSGVDPTPSGQIAEASGN